MPGLGSSQHLTSELLLRAAGDLRVTHVPYRGGGPLLQDLLAGTIDAGVVTFSAGAQQARAGHLVALAVTSEARPAAFPDVVTASGDRGAGLRADDLAGPAGAEGNARADPGADPQRDACRVEGSDRRGAPA